MSDVYYIYLEPWCRNAYMDLVLNGRDFYNSALHASMVNAEYMTTATRAVSEATPKLT